ncbi:MAG: alternate-type signal peptide domain-containing protein [Micrococcales bacterium]|nr:alternate-type signal peptide domain-containing protein [Micrococcales bacterium]
MNKIAKASIAGAAGVVLLMGGAGSLAYWNNSQNLGSNGTTITAGTLSASPASAGTWTTSFNNGTSTPGIPTAIVPGDKLTFTQTFTVTASGSDLIFSVGVTNPTLDSANKLAAKLVPAGAAVVQKSDGTTAAANGNGNYTVAAGVSKIVVTQTFTWGFGSAPASNTTGDNDAQGVSYTLPSTGVVTLTQTGS